MKFKVLPAVLTVLMTCGLASCGKKTSDREPVIPKAEVDKSESAIILENHLDLYQAILANDIATIKRLLENKSQIDLNLELENGETLITTAVARDLYPIVELLIENNASIHKTNAQNETPLMVAARLGLENLTRLLVTLGSKPDNKDLNGNTALHLTILNNHEEMALFLINSRANIDITNNDNQTALKLAEILNLKKVLALLQSLTQSSVGLPNKIVVRNLISLGDLESLNQLFIKFPAVVNDYRDLNFYVLIMRSHPHDKALSITHLMMSYGAHLDGPAGSDITPLIEAVKQRYDDFVALFLKENVNPNILDDKGQSALIWAIKGNSAPSVKMLLANYALEKYNYYEDGKKKTMKACDVARSMKRLSTTAEDKKSNAEILSILGCGRSWPF